MKPQKSRPPKIESLKHIPLFASFDDEEREALEEVMQRRQLDSGDVIFKQGAKGDTLIVVIDGLLRVSVTDEAGESANVGRINPGEVVGEMAVLDPAPRSATVVAATDCEVLELSRDGLLQLRRKAPAASSGIIENIIADVTRRLRDVNARIDQELNPDREEPKPKQGNRQKDLMSSLWDRLLKWFKRS